MHTIGNGGTMSRHSSPAFSWMVGAYGPEALSVLGLFETKSLSRPFDFRVDFFTRDGESLMVADLVGKDVLVTLSVRDGLSRFVHGQVRAIESLGLKTGCQRYRAHVAPKLWRLTQVHRSRICQGKSEPDILLLEQAVGRGADSRRPVPEPCMIPSLALEVASGRQLQAR
ncbi:contractile injection system protein, VgrG/Pvc8 family [Corallococcus sicarius]|uniref:Uncharacterized protein n=1 Tax=Corallococcus sicarius TaxID=2316726 RepID=A0A3A8MMI4_9BACT|nr:contractile injection system protein, VgrG/Pvc8 family [Corallococcus sicarius]RKH28742.1 hypothetical protein D7X12_40020 [Corallococcus sicarius]